MPYISYCGTKTCNSILRAAKKEGKLSEILTINGIKVTRKLVGGCKLILSSLGFGGFLFFFLVHECASLQAALRTRFLTKAQLPFHYAL